MTAAGAVAAARIALVGSAEFVPVVDRVSADDPEVAALVQGAGLVHLSGGSPPLLAATLQGTVRTCGCCRTSTASPAGCPTPC